MKFIKYNKTLKEDNAMMEGITLEKKENYAVLKVDIPATRNALSVPIVEYMDELVNQVIADKKMHCLIITGGGRNLSLQAQIYLDS